MARILKKSKKSKHFVRTKHQFCGAIVEFSKADVLGEPPKQYLICPFCKEQIDESIVKWRWE